ncbi:MAG: hypothetical protein FWG96_00805 [Methanomassiliicoccaceae archaeon]|nr:hypothetical protein [Methanomassiliicoccaceae archaeon]
MSESELRSLLSSFRCSAEPAAENFLNRIAVMHEKNGISRTYLFLEETDPGVDIIKGFFTLAVKCLAVDEHHSIPEDVLMQMNIDRGVAQAYLLGQLAKADGTEKGFGREMIERAFDIFSKGNEMFGCKVIRLDCKDRLKEYYESCGFTLTGKNHNGTLNQMVAII